MIIYLSVSVDNARLQFRRLGIRSLSDQRTYNSRSRTSPFPNGAVNETAPTRCPVRAGKEDVLSPCAHILEVICEEAGAREEPGHTKKSWLQLWAFVFGHAEEEDLPSALGELISGPVMKDLDELVSKTDISQYVNPA